MLRQRQALLLLLYASIAMMLCGWTSSSCCCHAWTLPRSFAAGHRHLLGKHARNTQFIALGAQSSSSFSASEADSSRYSRRPYKSGPSRQGKPRAKPSGADKTITELAQADKIQDAIRLMEQTFRENKDMQLQYNTFHAVVQACTRSRGRDTGLFAEAAIKQMLVFAKARRLDRRPKVAIFGMAIAAWGKSRHPEAGEKAEKILAFIATNYKASAIAYCSVMNVWAKQGNPVRAVSVFEKMLQDYKSGNKDAKPHVRAFNILIDAWAKSYLPNAGEKAEELLDQIIGMYESGDTTMRPTTVLYSSVMNVWAKQGNPEKAAFVFERMLQDYKSGNKDAKPDRHTFSTLIDAWARSDAPNAGEKAEEVLLQMTVMCESGDTTMRPDTVVYSSVMNVWAKQGNPGKAASVFERMLQDYKSGNKDAKPDRHSFSTLIDAWARSQLQNAGEKAEELLGQMTTLYEAGGTTMRPTTITYNSVMNVWAKQGNPGKTALVFERMLQDYKSGNKDAKPDPYSFAALLEGWANSGSPKCGIEADGIFDLMRTSDVEADEINYRLYLRCWLASEKTALGEERVKYIRNKLATIM